ncbi:substrate-binding domain-containing protein [Saccharicrinis aurantiacus]|uniref:substrate-binding domain-containing protein n=1 Tax=Saccharicrinis aurantiacus TaxID=1849719 RepID=UPI00094F8171|nr:LacI family DNA-binding transcriptional regulator [Saccharicrinis aurantiacus]
MSKVRIKDIAKEAGVSIGTVDRVLHKRGEVKEATKKKVLKIAEKLNYKPNIAARVLKSSTSYKIAIMLPKALGNNQYWSKHPIGFNNSLESIYPFTVDMQFFLYEMHNEDDFNRNAALILSWQPNGVILAPILKKESQTLCMQFDSLKIPYAFIDSFIDDTNSISFVGEDAYKGGRVAASVVDLGIEKEADILLVNIARNVQNVGHLNSRQKGFLSYFEDENTNTGQKINVEIPSDAIDDIKNVLDPIFATHTNIKGIVVTSSRTYAVAQYLKESKRSELFLVGYEVFDNNIKYLKDGVINYLIGQRPIEQAEKTFKKLFDFLAFNTTPDKKDYQPISIYNVENVSYL